MCLSVGAGGVERWRDWAVIQSVPGLKLVGLDQPLFLSFKNIDNLPYRTFVRMAT